MEVAFILLDAFLDETRLCLPRLLQIRCLSCATAPLLLASLLFLLLGLSDEIIKALHEVVPVVEG
jgi:hypothetical protein